MALSFGKTKAKNFERVFKDNPKPLVQNAYLNFLRSYKAEHPDCSVKRILQRGAMKWKKLTPAQQEEFSTRKVLPTVLANRKRKPDFKKYMLPKCKPLSYAKRSMNVEKNVRNSWRKVKNLPPKNGKKTPKIIQKGRKMVRSDDVEGMSSDDYLVMLCVDEDDLDNKNSDTDVNNRFDDLMNDELSGEDDIDDDDDVGKDQRAIKGIDQPDDAGEGGDDSDENDEDKYVYFVPK